jgi:hypothetical protein
MNNNICTYEAHEVLKISNCSVKFGTNEFFRLGKTSLHLYSSHYCNDFLSSIKDFTTEKTNKDYFVVPVAIKIRRLGCESEADYVCDMLVNSLSHFKGMEDKHVFFLVGDSTYVPKSLLGSRVFMESCPAGSRAEALHYTSPIVGLKSKPIKDCIFDVSFQGNTSTNPVRLRLKEALKKSALKTKFVESEAMPLPPQRHPQSNSYFELMNDTKFILCPRGAGVNSIRFFESISLGRIPVVIGNDFKMPLCDYIDWDSLIVRLNDSLDDLDEKISAADIDSGEKLRCIWNNYFDRFDRFLSFSLDSPSSKKSYKRGVLMCATGSPGYFDMAQKSICILNRHEKIESTIVTDCKKKGNFSNIIHLHATGFKSKILAILNCPYEECIYMDSDTRACGRVSEMFELLKEKQIWMMPAPARKPEYNTGVVVFRKTKNVIELFSMWKNLYEKGINHPHDQPALLEAIKLLNFDVGLLDEKYNSHEEKSGTVIVHSKKALILASKTMI